MDNSRPDPLADLGAYLNSFAELIARAGCVIAVGRTESHPHPSLDHYGDFVASKGITTPVIPADVRNPDEVINIVELLLMQFEAKTAA